MDFNGFVATRGSGTTWKHNIDITLPAAAGNRVDNSGETDLKELRGEMQGRSEDTSMWVNPLERTFSLYM